MVGATGFVKRCEVVWMEPFANPTCVPEANSCKMSVFLNSLGLRFLSYVCNCLI